MQSKSLEWCALEHLHRLVLADLLDELLEAVLAKLLRDGVRSPSLSLRVCSRTARTTDKRRVREGDGVGLVGGVERDLLALGSRVVAPEREVDGLHGRLLVRTPVATSLREARCRSGDMDPSS